MIDRQLENLILYAEEMIKDTLIISIVPNQAFEWLMYLAALDDFNFYREVE